MVFQTLNRLKWTNRLEMAEIVILHRGDENDKKVIPGNKITEVKRSYFSYVSPKGEITIPLHRVLEIKEEGRVIWRRKFKS
jgi:uncharacterized protein (UPF0248 family)